MKPSRCSMPSLILSVGIGTLCIRIQIKPEIRRPGLDLVFGLRVLDKVGAHFQSLPWGSFAPSLWKHLHSSTDIYLLCLMKS